MATGQRNASNELRGIFFKEHSKEHYIGTIFLHHRYFPQSKRSTPLIAYFYVPYLSNDSASEFTLVPIAVGAFSLLLYLSTANAGSMLIGERGELNSVAAITIDPTAFETFELCACMASNFEVRNLGRSGL